MHGERYTGAKVQLLRRLALIATLVLGLQAQAQTTAATAASGEVAKEPPSELKLPDLRDLGLGVTRPVRAASAMVGMGRQRLALVLGLGTIGTRQVLDSAARDSQAVASALREAGFVVMLREDLPASELRATLKEFQERLQPGGLGFIYATGLGAQVDGQNVLLPRDAVLEPTQDLVARLARLRAQAVPLTELVNALLGPAESPRLLVVDAAYRHPALIDLPTPGYAAQRLPPGMIALFGLGLGQVQEVPAVAALPQPAPSEPQQIAATPFARVLVGQLMKPRVKGPDALRATRRLLSEGSLGQVDPWIDGDTDGEEIAEASPLDLVPRTPEDLAREAVRQVVRTTRSGGTAGSVVNSTVSTTVSTTATTTGGGEQSVTDVLDRARRLPGPNKLVGDEAQALNSNSPTMRPNAIRGGLGEGQNLPSSSVGNALGSAASATGTVAGTAASVAGSVAAAAAVVKVAVAEAAVSAAATVAGAASSLATQAMSLVKGTGETPATVAAAKENVGAATAAAPPPAGANTAASPPAPAPRVASAHAAAPEPVATLAAAEAKEESVASVLAAVKPVVRPAAPIVPVAPIAPVTPVVPAAEVAVAATAAAAAPLAASTAPTTADARTVRNAEGGERPAYAPRKNAFGYAEGDTYSYQVRNTWKGEITGAYTTAIEEVLDNGQMLANGHQVRLDPEGRLVRQVHDDGRVSQFDPPQALWWANPKRGESRDLRFVETIANRGGRKLGEIEWKGSASVGRPRKIEIPAGEVEAVPIESSGWQYEQRGDGTRIDSKWSRTVWYSTQLGHPVAIDIEDTDRLGKLLRRERIELLHAQSARTIP